MQTRRYALVGLVVAAAMCWTGTAGAVLPTKAQVCEAAKVTAAGTKQKCLATERAKEVKGQIPNYAKCDAALTKAFTKAETTAGAGVCPTQGDAAAVEAQIDAAADRLNAALSGDTPPATHLFPATGQTTCWDGDGAVISCAGTGQDGDIQAGAALSYTDNGDGTITDNNTGLMWERKGAVGSIHDPNAVYTWADAFSSFLTPLNNRCGNDETMACTSDANCAGVGGRCGFAGHRDWRLPNVKELMSITSYGNSHAAVSPAFDSSALAAFYWSSTNGPGVYAYGVDFAGGLVRATDKPGPFRVRAVRGGL